MAGAAAVSGAALAYGWGAVLARPLLRRYPSGVVAGATTLIGGLVLMVLSLALEPGAIEALSGRWGWAAWSGWLFLVLFGSLIGYSVYMRLLRDIGPTRSGAYAFVSPVIAVALGIAVFGETAGPIDIAAMIVMLVAAWLAMAGQEQAGRPLIAVHFQQLLRRVVLADRHCADARQMSVRQSRFRSPGVELGLDRGHVFFGRGRLRNLEPGIT